MKNFYNVEFGASSFGFFLVGLNCPLISSPKEGIPLGECKRQIVLSGSFVSPNFSQSIITSVVIEIILDILNGQSLIVLNAFER